RLDELRTARGVTKDQLFAAAVEFFSGNALIRYRSVRDQVKDWDELVAALRQTFLPCDYEATLWDEIRTQGPNEPVAAAEDTQVRAAKFRNPSSSLKNVLEPDLAYRKSSPGFKISAIGSESFLVASTLNQATAVETILSMSCWNCSQPGHLAAQYSAPKRLHCYKCGAPNVTTRTCPKCAGNAQRRR
ncbi:hypothetical protein ILUMI_14054, partial [Ignelater luminosus]